MSSTNELVVAKKKLDETLGDNFKLYLQTMRKWFTEQITKEEFDSQVREFLSMDSVMAHNAFLLALLNKCTQLVDIIDATTPTTTNVIKTEPKISVKTETKAKPVIKPLKKRLKTLKKLHFDCRYVPTLGYENAYLHNVKLLDDCTKLSKVSYCQRESVLPDHFMSHLRVFVISWEMGLDGVQDNAVKLCNAALRDFIKNILTEIFSSRSSYRLRDNRFKYAIGAPPINPYLKNSYSLIQTADHLPTVTNPETGESIGIRPTIDDATNNAMYWMACGQHSNKRVSYDNDPINLRHLLHVLKTNRNVIPSHSVRCNAFYKTVCKLNDNDCDREYE